MKTRCILVCDTVVFGRYMSSLGGGDSVHVTAELAGFSEMIVQRAETFTGFRTAGNNYLFDT